MKKVLLCLLILLAPLGHVLALEGPARVPLGPQQYQAATAKMIATLLTRYHYTAPRLDDALSAKVFDRYLQSLDPEKLLFLQADIDAFSAARTKLDNAISNEDVRFPFTLYNLYRDRQVERFTYSRQVLKTAFDFTGQESIEYDRKNAPWPRTMDEIRDQWRKRVKNDWLRLKLAGQKDDAIRSTLDKRYEGYLGRIDKVNPNDVFQIFMDAYATAIDPHSNYLGPKASEEFDISMKLSLVGIGAVLQSRDDYTMIRELVPGGPAALSGKLQIGDRIVGVGQGADGAISEVLGWRLDDVVSQIRGALDTVVVLDVLPADAGPDTKHKRVQLTRKKISIEEQAAKKSEIEIKDAHGAHKIGVITLPSFYEDFEARRSGDKNYKSAARDVERLLGELKKDKVEGVVIDLRNNGGGSLRQAVELTGLFIDQGPVVQQRDAKGQIAVEADTRAGYSWTGPMAVLINRFSASASEIFAAAIQDYGRGVILGEPSFGKGTVQTVISLDQLLKSEKPTYGEVKFTVAEFFRINGNTTQLRGVTPDIAYPLLNDIEHMGESSFDNALPASQIKPADYLPAGDLTAVIPSLRSRHEARMSAEKTLKRIIDDANEIAVLRKRATISLNEAERRAERDAMEARAKKRAEEEARENGAKAGKTKAEIDEDLQASSDDGLLDNERSIERSRGAGKKKRERPDALLTESAHVLSDEVDLLTANPKLAVRVVPADLRLTKK
ncbi:carboxy terminal-processing peptidase [Niveibacterium umoris]|uniref:Carboxyl-terminal processing protease n=1 Tax=Niveibacterium umoris TaxID=1193620 RepID=A0A840BEW0_9RHOO|nr:carboxy terminal-processing peptidase [Niveibacterium umoris]MBB4011685.1 carboxyl-terminal processing protease [Niveibacterium umoris]